MDAVTDTEFPAVSRVQRRVANMPKMPVALVTSVAEKSWKGGGGTSFTKVFKFFLKETNSVQAVKGLHLRK